MDYTKINEAAMGYKDDMTRFLRDLVRIPEKKAFLFLFAKKKKGIPRFCII